MTDITNAEHNELLHHDNWAQGFDTAFYTTPQPTIPAWQPIETAPKGISVLACNATGYIGRAIFHYEKWDHIGNPTHWMPLPAAPKEMK